MRHAAWLLLAAGACAQAEPVLYRIDPAHTHVHFELRHFGTSTIRGRFDKLDGSITLDRAARTGDVSISVDTGALSTGTPVFDGVIRGTQLLDTKAQPQAYFVARQLSFDGDKLASLTGEFTLRGVSRPLTLQAMQFSCGLHPLLKREWCGGDFEGEFDRSAFGITFGLPFVTDRVRLQIQVEAVRD